MIGQLINEFDDLLDPTLEDFNKTFKMSLKGDLSAPVTIGSMTLGGLREVVVGGKIELISIDEIRGKGEVVKDKRLTGRPSPFLYLGEKDGVKRTFYSLNDIRDEVDIPYTTVCYRLDNNLAIDGWKIEKVLKTK